MPSATRFEIATSALRGVSHRHGRGGEGSGMLTGSMRARNTVLAVIGVAALMLKAAYAGPFAEAVHSYAGNVAVSFALYFAAVSGTQRLPRPRLVAAAIVLLAVTAFEITDGFGVMANVYDPVDLFANAAGVGFAIVVDAVSARLLGASESDA